VEAVIACPSTDSTSLYGIRQEAGFLGPTRVHTPNGISVGSAVFGRPFAKRFALCYWTVVCRSCRHPSVVTAAE